jgi:hypothetical protein
MTTCSTSITIVVTWAHRPGLAGCLSGEVAFDSQSGFGAVEVAAHELHDRRGRIPDQRPELRLMILRRMPA